MPFADIDGIKTHYQVSGDGPPLLLLEPVGFGPSMLRRWPNRVWRGFRPLEVLARDFRLIAYDRRESGESGGRVEPLTWELAARHANALLDYLEVEDAFVLGGCVGCSVALALAAFFPERCRALLLHWPVGGFRWVTRGRGNFDRHIAFAREQGLVRVAERAKPSTLFWSDPEGGPWSSVIASDAAFVRSFIRQDLDCYLRVLAESRDHLFHDAMPAGATGEQLMAMKVPAFIMPGDDILHSTSTGHVLRELMPRAKLAPLMPPQQNPATIAQWVYESTASPDAARPSIAA